MNKNKIYVVGHCDTGFGDQYASLITTYNAVVKLKERGYVPHLFLSKEHKYFSLQTSITKVYNISSYECDFEEMRYVEVLENLKDFKLMIRSSFLQIWVSQDNDDDFSFIEPSISMYNIGYMMEPIFSNKILSSEIIEIAKEKFIGDKKNIATLHFRTSDLTINSDLDIIREDGFWGDKFNKSIKFVEKYNDHSVMVCSANKNVNNFFLENFDNVFINNFTNKNLPFYLMYGHDFVEDDTPYVEHCKEILAEMACLQWSKKIYSIMTHSSNFAFYGTINNLNYNSWEDKLKFTHFNENTDFN